jgi:hypothetical protein
MCIIHVRQNLRELDKNLSLYDSKCIQEKVRFIAKNNKDIDDINHEIETHKHDASDVLGQGWYSRNYNSTNFINLPQSLRRIEELSLENRELQSQINGIIIRIIEYPMIVYEEIECSICLETVNNHVITNCNHKFCKNCFDNISNNKCALCRSSLFNI